jgi:hypothetical protein
MDGEVVSVEAAHLREEEITEIPTEPPSEITEIPTEPPSAHRGAAADAEHPDAEPRRSRRVDILRDTRTPDHESRLWPMSDEGSVALPPPRRGSQLRAGVVKRTEAVERWKSLRGSFFGHDDDDQGPARAGTLANRQMQLKGTLHVNHELKQAIYDQWTLKPPQSKSHGMLDELVDWEVYFKTRVQKLFQNAVALVQGPGQPTTLSSDLTVMSGFVFSQRRTLFGAKTVRHYVQLCVDGKFVMLKTEQPNSPVTVALHVKDVEIENDPDCDLTLKLTPITPRRQLGTASRQRAVTFTVNDPATKEGWLKAFSIQKRMTTEGASVQKRVASFVSQLKSSTDHSAVSRATAGLIKGHQRMRSSADTVPPIAPDAFCSALKRATSI